MLVSFYIYPNVLVATIIASKLGIEDGILYGGNEQVKLATLNATGKWMLHDSHLLCDYFEISTEIGGYSS